MNPVMLVQSWRKLVPDRDDLQNFPNKEISKSKILDMLCAMRSFKKVTMNNGYKVMCVCELSLHHMTANPAMKQKGE
jgi:hypothetical protein